MIKGHGGNKKGLAEYLGCSADDIIDMSSNLNPLGLQENMEEIIIENVRKIRSLPEADASTIKKGFAKFHGIDHRKVVAGNGTTSFIYILPGALGSKKVLISGPTYSDYKDACIIYHSEYRHYTAWSSQGFEPDIDRISEMAGNADTVFICNPNNPTGSLIPREKIEYLIKRNGNSCFIIDESYLPFVKNADDISLVSENKYPNIIVLSSMSKIFGIPGLRTGFLNADLPLVEKIMKYYQPWCVNALAQAVMENIFENPEKIKRFYQKTENYIDEEKRIFFRDLEKLEGISLFDSSTYFILAELTNSLVSKDFCRKVGRDKILIRDCSNFDGLSNKFIRFSLKTRKINRKLSYSIRQVIENG